MGLLNFKYYHDLYAFKDFSFIAWIMAESCTVDLLEFEVMVTSPKSGDCYA